MAALCLNYGQVTRDMLNVWATDLWQMESALQANPSLTNSLSTDVYQGTTMYLCGMSYYEKMSQFQTVNPACTNSTRFRPLRRACPRSARIGTAPAT